MDQKNNMLKIVMVGESSVGKTCLIKRYVDNNFSHSLLPTVGIDYINKKIEINEKDYVLQIWDTAGQEQFHAITKSYFRRANGIVLVYDVTNPSSFARIREWVDAIDDSNEDSCEIILAANKIDVDEADRKVTTDEGELLAHEIHSNYIEVSAKTGQGVADLFLTLALHCKIYREIQDAQNPEPIYIEIETEDESEISGGRRKCC